MMFPLIYHNILISSDFLPFKRILRCLKNLSGRQEFLTCPARLDRLESEKQGRKQGTNSARESAFGGGAYG
jgi:hypothetical protein